MIVDAAPEIPGDPLHFFDSVHFTDAGSRVMADTMYEALVAAPEFEALMRGESQAR